MTFLIWLAHVIDCFNDMVGRKIAWLALAMASVQFIVVLMRYVFGASEIWLQESILYMHGALFMLGAGYTLLHNGHVRIDIFYRPASPTRKAWVDLIGVFIFLAPICIAIFYITWSYVADSWAIWEGSRETSGIQAVYLLKTVILAFAALLFLQGISMAIHAASVLLGCETPKIESLRRP